MYLKTPMTNQGLSHGVGLLQHQNYTQEKVEFLFTHITYNMGQYITKGLFELPLQGHIVDRYS